MPINQTSMFTKVITNTTFTVTPEMGLRSVSFVLESGSGQFRGSLNLPGITADFIPLIVGQPVTISADGPDSLAQIELDSTATGVIHLIAKQ